METRPIEIERETAETTIALSLDLSAHGPQEISIDIPFFQHLLQALAFHGDFALTVTANGDIEVDTHHLVEDVGIVFGEALAQTVRKYGAVQRFGYTVVPMDEALSEAAIDVCGRPHLTFSGCFPQEWVGSFNVPVLREFLLGCANNAMIALHAHCRYGQNSHHMAESLFKALGKSIKKAYSPNTDKNSPQSTKGML